MPDSDVGPSRSGVSMMLIEVNAIRSDGDCPAATAPGRGGAGLIGFTASRQPATRLAGSKLASQ